MTSYVIRVNERMRLGKSFLDYLKYVCQTSNCVDIIAKEDSKLIDERYFTIADFERVEKSKKSGICDDITKLENLLKSKK